MKIINKEMVKEILEYIESNLDFSYILNNKIIDAPVKNKNEFIIQTIDKFASFIKSRNNKLDFISIRIDKTDESFMNKIMINENGKLIYSSKIILLNIVNNGLNIIENRPGISTISKFHASPIMDYKTPEVFYTNYAFIEFIFNYLPKEDRYAHGANLIFRGNSCFENQKESYLIPLTKRETIDGKIKLRKLWEEV